MYRYPLPGWSDNMNGPAGLLIAAGKGVLRTMYMPKTTYADFAPVDLVGNALCVITYAYLSYPYVTALSPKPLLNQKIKLIILEKTVKPGA